MVGASPPTNTFLVRPGAPPLPLPPPRGPGCSSFGTAFFASTCDGKSHFVTLRHRAVHCDAVLPRPQWELPRDAITGELKPRLGYQLQLEFKSPSQHAARNRACTKVTATSRDEHVAMRCMQSMLGTSSERQDLNIDVS